MRIHGINNIINSCVSGVNISGMNNVVVVNGVVVSGGGDCIVASDKMVTRKLESVDTFRSILNMTGINVEYTEVAAEADTKIEITAPDNIIDFIKVDIEDKLLYIHTEPGKNFSCGFNNCPRIVIKGHLVNSFANSGSADMVVKGKPAFDSPMPFSLDCGGSGSIDARKYKATFSSGRITVGGSGEIFVGDLKGDSIDVAVHGSGDITLDKVQCNNLSASVSGSGDVDVSGKATRVEFSVYGSGDISARGLKAKEGKASVSGSGDIRCCVKTLSERCYGSGDIYNMA